MTVEHLEVLVEEQSTEEALKLLFPKVAPSLSFTVHSHQGKNDLLMKLPGKLRAYRKHIPPAWRIVVILDRDGDDCDALKERMEAMAHAAGHRTRAMAATAPWIVANRIAIEELEAWFFGDWKAVLKAYPGVSSTVPAQAKYRHPDDIKGGTWEALERLLQKAGYFAGGLRKIELARAVAAHLNPSSNTSPSFCALRDVIDELTA